MREEVSNWFPKWEDELPSPEELMPLSQTLISPDLALAFDIRNPGNTAAVPPQSHHHAPAPPVSAVHTPSSQPNSSAEFDSGEMGGGGGAGDEPARTLKRPRLVWTPQLHKRFVDAVAHLGIKNAGLSNGGAGNNSGAGAGAGDPATDHLFASSPVPAHFLHPGRPNSEHFMPFVNIPAMQHHQQMAAVLHPPYRHFGSPPNAQFEHPFVSRQSQQRMGTPVHNNRSPVAPPYAVDDVESAAANARKVLTLFPTGDD
nr:transcription factor MYBC1-like [Ipomoea batatas]